MADRGRGAPRGGGGIGGSFGGGRGGGPARRPPGGQPPATGSGEKPKREAILDLARYNDERIRVKFAGGREITGLLKGYDQLLNIVLDDVVEELQLPTPHTRKLGLVVVRGPAITVLNPVDGSEEIANPFAAAE